MRLVFPFSGSLIVGLVIWVVLSCDAGTATPEATNRPAVQESQWEYLIVSFGKTTFFDLQELPELQLVGLAKMSLYQQLDIGTAQEAVTTEAQLDALGRYGWELIQIVGSIGGDQQVVFKRAMDPERSAREKELIKAEGAKMVEAKRKAAEAQQPDSPDTPPIDLDRSEELAKEVAEDTSLRKAVEGCKLDGGSISGVSISRPGSGRTVTLRIDGTHSLLHDGNKYRRSAANQLAGKLSEALKKGQVLAEYAILGDKERITLRSSVFVSYKGKEYDVGSGYDILSLK